MHDHFKQLIKDNYVPPGRPERYRFLFSYVPLGTKCIRCNKPLSDHERKGVDDYLCKNGESFIMGEDAVKGWAPSLKKDPNFLYKIKQMERSK